MHTFTRLFKCINNWKTRGESRVMHHNCWFFLVAVFVLVFKVKDFPDALGGWLHRVLSWLDILTPLALDRWILCAAFYGGNRLFLYLPLSSQAYVPHLLALHLQVASWSDKLRQSKGCGSLNQHSLHAFSACSPFFLQRQRKQPQAAHLPGGNESQTTPGLFPEAILWLCSKATGRNCLAL